MRMDWGGKVRNLYLESKVKLKLDWRKIRLGKIVNDVSNLKASHTVIV